MGIFKSFKTYDFEKVLSNLSTAKLVAEQYNNDLSNKIEMDLKKIRDSFIQSIAYTHPKSQTELSVQAKSEARKFLSNFHEIFTTNYDLLLYWILRAEESNSIKIPADNDGFGYPKYEHPTLPNPIWVNHLDQRCHYLHGALHIFESEEYISKLAWDKSANLVNKVSAQIEKDNHPIMIFEGSYKQKENKINQSPYLWYAHEKFKEIFGALFIFGSSLNESSDKHIINAIKNNKTLTRIYVGLYDADPEMPQIIETANSLKTEGKTVEFFNSKNITQWEAIQPKSK